MTYKCKMLNFEVRSLVRTCVRACVLESGGILRSCKQNVGVGSAKVLHPRPVGARCSSAVRAFAHGAMGRRIDPSWSGPIELFLVPASAPRLV